MRAGFAVLALLLLLGGCTTVGEPVQTPEQREKAAEINVQLGVGYLRQGNLELSKAKLEKALELDSRYAPAHMYYGMLQERLGRLEVAEHHYRRAVALDDESPEANNNYGAFLCRRDRVAEAERFFKAAVANPLYKTPEFAWTNAGICAMKIPDYEKAREYLRKALQAEPRFPSALSNLARVEFELGNYSKARAYLKRFHELSEFTADSLWLAIRTEHRLQDPDAMASYGLLLKSRFPDSQEAELFRRAQQGDGSY